MNEDINVDNVDNTGVDNTSVVEESSALNDSIPVVDSSDNENNPVGDTDIVDSGIDEAATRAEEQQKNEQINFKALRQAKKQIEKERDELALRVKELSEARKAEDVYSDDIDEESSTHRDVQELKKQWADQQNQLKTRSIEEKLKAEFPDLEQVVTEDNIEVLKARDPNFAKIINRAPSEPDELYHRAVAAHTLIKKYGIYVKDNHVKDRERVVKNMAKPRPASAASSASSSSEGLADFSSFAGMNEDDRRKAIFKLARERANN